MSERTAAARRRVRELMPVEGDIGFRRRAETIIEFLDVQPDETVLDCGCGYGFTLRVLGELTESRLIGLDLGADRLDQTRAALGNRVELVRGNAQELPFADGSIDKAVSSEVFEHLPDDRAAARELFRVLKPGGTLVITVPAAEFPFGWDPVNWALKRSTGGHIGGERMFSGIWYGHLRLYDKPGLAALLRESGFEVEATRGLTHYVPPFTHLVMYGMLKPLLMSGKLPKALSGAGDRHAKQSEPSGVVGLAAKALNAWDHRNDAADLDYRVDSFVAIAAVARKPIT